MLRQLPVWVATLAYGRGSRHSWGIVAVAGAVLLVAVFFDAWLFGVDWRADLRYLGQDATALASAVASLASNVAALALVMGLLCLIVRRQPTGDDAPPRR